MPYIEAIFSQNLGEEKIIEIKKSAGNLIDVLPGKTEQQLMIRIEENANMYFRGIKEQCAFISVSLYMTTPFEEKGIFAERFIESISELTEIEINNIFLSFREYHCWVTNGKIK